MHVGTEENH